MAGLRGASWTGAQRTLELANGGVGILKSSRAQVVQRRADSKHWSPLPHGRCWQYRSSCPVNPAFAT